MSCALLSCAGAGSGFDTVVMSNDPAPSSETRLAVLGPGLLGASLALAAKVRWPEMEVALWARRPEAVRQVLEHRVAAQASTDLAEVVAGASLIVLATPVDTLGALAAQLAELPLAEGTVITDVGSVKGLVVAELEPMFSAGAASFIGSHPMAGSEKAGMAAARADLFHGATCVLTPTECSLPAALARVRAFWTGLGCRLVEFSPAEHDRLVARISHLPHLMAAVTTLAALSADRAPLDCAGNGFRDTTRVAAGDPDLWTGIIRQNHSEILTAVRDAAAQTAELLAILEALDEEKLRRFLSEAKRLRDLLPALPASAYGHPDC